MNYPCFGFTWVGPQPWPQPFICLGGKARRRGRSPLSSQPFPLQRSIAVLLNLRLYRAQTDSSGTGMTLLIVLSFGAGNAKTESVLVRELCIRPPPGSTGRTRDSGIMFGAAKARLFTGPRRYPSGIFSGLVLPAGSIYKPGIRSLS